ncbi:NAD(P)-dependent oxidoreductase [Photobacterium kasasachensis]|uniref:NAD(P)-dependent oxidoreductase n=1 Tax=Photobacterium kasasachensis TaxID=2910240 RepID=UPI003D137E1B
MEYSKLLILGGSGAIGRKVTDYALQRGYQVTLVVRNKNSIGPQESVKIIEGNVLDNAILEQAIQGQDAVISCLGIKRKNGKNPWSSLVSPKNFAEQATQKVLNLMEKYQVKRLITVSSAGVGDSKKHMSFAMNSLIQISNVKLSFADLDKMEQAMQSSTLDTLAVRPVSLTDSEQVQPTGIVNKFKMSSTISRASVASWMIDAVARPERFTHPTEMIGSI